MIVKYNEKDNKKRIDEVNSGDVFIHDGLIFQLIDDDAGLINSGQFGNTYAMESVTGLLDSFNDDTIVEVKPNSFIEVC